MTIHMLLSDLIPLTLFVLYAATANPPPPPLWGPIISRLFSLLYHTFETTHPALLSLDYLGICSMALSVPAACALAEGGAGGICGPYVAATMLMLGAAVVEIGVHAFARRTTVFRSPEHAVVALGLLGNLPVVAIVANPAHPPATRLLFAFSLAAFAVFGLKPTHHVLWHWAAAAGQAAGVAAIA
jgi:hypothetical protein